MEKGFLFLIHKRFTSPSALWAPRQGADLLRIKFMEVLYKYYENIQRRKFSPGGDVRLGGQWGKRLYLILNNITYVLYI